ncbi:MAG: LCP family protein [Ruminococcus sp.]|nr:LCP family protein [Ruminococcus sp.]MBR4622857.1 LCP family protein [Ruminococcus sp.]
MSDKNKLIGSEDDELEQIISAAISKKKQREQQTEEPAEVPSDADNGESDLGDIISAAMAKKKERALAASTEMKDVPEKAEAPKEPEPEKEELPRPDRSEKPEIKDEEPEKKPSEKIDDEIKPVPKEKIAAAAARDPEHRPAQRKRPAGAGNGNRARNGQHTKNGHPKNIRPENGKQSSRSKTAGSSSQGKKTSGGKNGKGKKKKLTTKQKILFIAGTVFLGLCLIALVIFLIFHFYFGKLAGEDSRADPSAPMSYADTDPNMSDTFDPEEEERRLKEELERNATDIMSDQDVFNVLLVGEDLRSGSEEVRGNTDVMMLISLNKRLGTITMTSFMRDLYLYIPDIDASDRLNAAYYLSGITTLKDTIQQYFAVKIDRYVIVNFNQFVEIVDTLGGLDIEITNDEAHGYLNERTNNPDGDNTRGMENPLDEQNAILGNDWGTDYLPELSEEGEIVHCNGNQALAYARLRHIDKGTKYADFGRTARQREVISLIIKKAKGASLMQLKELADKILPDTYTDLEEGETASLLLHAFEYMGYEIQQVQIPAEETFSGHFVDHKSVLLADLRANARIVQQMIYGTTVIEEDSRDENDTTPSSNPYDHNGYYDDNGNWIDYEDQYRYGNNSSNYNAF